MNLIEVFKEIKSYDARSDNNIMKVYISVKDNLISLSDLPLSVDDMIADDWDLITHYKMGNSYEELEQ